MKMSSDEKACTRCSAVLRLDQFNRDRKNRDGRTYECKECAKKRVHEYCKANIEIVRAKNRLRGLSPEHKKANRQRYRKAMSTPEGREKENAYKKRWRLNNKEKRTAHLRTANAIRYGVLKWSPCERCNSEDNVDAHHEDYSKPLDVTWLCKPCHGIRHREINEQRRSDSMA